MIGRSPIYVLSISRNYGGLIPLPALQITIAKKSKNFSRDSGILIPASGVDFFVQNVGNENCLVVPPVTMITKAIHYLYASRAIGTVIVRFWPSAYFWPVIIRKFRDHVTGYEAFKARWALRHGTNTNSQLGSEAFDGDVLAIKMNFP